MGYDRHVYPRSLANQASTGSRSAAWANLAFSKSIFEVSAFFCRGILPHLSSLQEKPHAFFAGCWRAGTASASRSEAMTVAVGLSPCHYPHLFHACISYAALQFVISPHVTAVAGWVPRPSAYENNNAATRWSVGPGGICVRQPGRPSSE